MQQQQQLCTFEIYFRKEFKQKVPLSSENELCNALENLRVT
jgi:hypothetical protein